MAAFLYLDAGTGVRRRYLVGIGGRSMSGFIREIAITEIDGVSIGHAQNDEAKTGVSVLYFKRGAQTGCDISGGGPASRETPLTDSMTADNPLNAVVL